MVVDNVEESWDKENKAPKTPVNNQTGKQFENVPQDFKCSLIAESRGITKSSNMTGASARRLLPGPEKAKPIPLTPRSNSTMDDNISLLHFIDNNLLNTKHAWAALTPDSGKKHGRNRSLPILNGSNVTVDSPDPTSKYFKSPPVDRHSDSPESEGCFLAVNDIMAMTMISLGLSDPRRKVRRGSIPMPSPKRRLSGERSSEGEFFPELNGDGVTIDSPDPNSKYNSNYNTNNNRNNNSNSNSSSSGNNNNQSSNKNRSSSHRSLKVTLHQVRSESALISMKDKKENDDKLIINGTNNTNNNTNNSTNKIRLESKSEKSSSRVSFESPPGALKSTDDGDIFMSSMSPFKPDYNAVLSKLRLVDDISTPPNNMKKHSRSRSEKNDNINNDINNDKTMRSEKSNKNKSKNVERNNDGNIDENCFSVDDILSPKGFSGFEDTLRNSQINCLSPFSPPALSPFSSTVQALNFDQKDGRNDGDLRNVSGGRNERDERNESVIAHLENDFDDIDEMNNDTNTKCTDNNIDRNECNNTDIDGNDYSYINKNRPLDQSNQNKKLVYSPSASESPVSEFEGKYDSESISFIQDLRRRKSEMSFNTMASSTVRRRSYDETDLISANNDRSNDRNIDKNDQNSGKSYDKYGDRNDRNNDKYSGKEMKDDDRGSVRESRGNKDNSTEIMKENNENKENPNIKNYKEVRDMKDYFKDKKEIKDREIKENKEKELRDMKEKDYKEKEKDRENKDNKDSKDKEPKEPFNPSTKIIKPSPPPVCMKKNEIKSRFERLQPVGPGEINRGGGGGPATHRAPATQQGASYTTFVKNGRTYRSAAPACEYSPKLIASPGKRRTGSAPINNNNGYNNGSNNHNSGGVNHGAYYSNFNNGNSGNNNDVNNYDYQVVHNNDNEIISEKENPLHRHLNNNNNNQRDSRDDKENKENEKYFTKDSIRIKPTMKIGTSTSSHGPGTSSYGVVSRTTSEAIDVRQAIKSQQINIMKLNSISGSVSGSGVLLNKKISSPTNSNSNNSTNYNNNNNNNDNSTNGSFVPPSTTEHKSSLYKRNVSRYFAPSTQHEPSHTTSSSLNTTSNTTSTYISPYNKKHICSPIAEEKQSRPVRIRVSKSSVSHIPYVRTRHTKRKRKSVSYYLVRGVSLESVPENEELTDFLEYITIERPRRHKY